MQARSLFDSPHHTASSRWIQRTASRLCVGICDLWDNIHPPRISHHWSPPSPHMRFVGHTLLWHWWIWGLVHEEFQDRRQTRNCWFPTSKYHSLWYRRHSHLSFSKPPGSLLWCSHPLVFWPTTALTTSWRRNMCHLQSSSKTKWSKRYHTHRQWQQCGRSHWGKANQGLEEFPFQEFLRLWKQLVSKLVHTNWKLNINPYHGSNSKRFQKQRCKMVWIQNTKHTSTHQNVNKSVGLLTEFQKSVRFAGSQRRPFDLATTQLRWFETIWSHRRPRISHPKFPCEKPTWHAAGLEIRNHALNEVL